MKDRLLAVIKQKEMSVSQFADAVGIQRSTFHHIISGRNNPSLDVVTRIHATFPDIDLEWLISGNGNSSMSDRPYRQELFPLENAIIPTGVEEVPKYPIPDGGDGKVSHNKTATESVDCTKKVTKIILVFSDGTTQTFAPEG